MRRFTRYYVGYPSDIYLSLYIQNIDIITTTSALLSGMIKISTLFQLVESQMSGTMGTWVHYLLSVHTLIATAISRSIKNAHPELLGNEEVGDVGNHDGLKQDDHDQL